MNTLKAEKRSMDDKAKKLRREGYVTGNVFGRSLAESIPVRLRRKKQSVSYQFATKVVRQSLQSIQQIMMFL